MIDLTAAGLNETEAKCYQALIEKQDWKPAELAEYVQETRTNCYKILDNLVAKGLAERFDKAKKLHYRAANPTRLLELAREHREAREAAEKDLVVQAELLMHDYIKVSEQPGIRFFQGKEAIKAIFEDMLTATTPIHLVRSSSDVEFYDQAFYDDFRARRAKNGIETHAITPKTGHALLNKADDEAFAFIRTMIPAADYRGSVEWNTYDDKLAVISYGQEAIGMIIESPQIADSFRQLVTLVETLSNRETT